ncbi:MAG TPA: antibiotic biosynthesis monooxygenase [Candidatus Acidoferrales bacterium]|jgi:heme-degrading monooxygenase HmoA
MIQIVWEFVASPGQTLEFERCYAPDGRWAELFRRAPGYRGTSLLRDAEEPRRYLTIDRWETAAAHQSMRERLAQEYAALDRACEPLTESERRIGVFEGE